MSKVIIIAEAGVNHNGSMVLAKQLIDVAVDAGVDIVKFQTFSASKIVSKNAKKADYQINLTGNSETQYEMLKRLELSFENHIELLNYCKQRNIQFWSTAFDDESIELLKKIGIDSWKIPSGEITNLPFLKKIGSFSQKVILSTGMCYLNEIEEAVDVLIKSGTPKNNITILHCNTEYPTPMEDVNLNAMLTIKNKLNVLVGYSDHTEGIEVAIAATAMGANVIEKHFTLDKNMEGPDHKASLEPDELAEMVKAIRNIEKAISGNGEKKPSPSEDKNIKIARKSIHLNKNLIKGHIITSDDLIALRPGDGISPMNWDSLIGKKLVIDKNEFDKLLNSDLE